MATRREALTREAARLFAERGFHGTSMDALAQALGVQKGSLYSLTGSKQELLYETMREGARAPFTQPWTRFPRTAAGRSSVCWSRSRGHLRVVSEQLDVATVFTREWRYLEGEHRDEIVAERRRYEERWRSLFREGVESGGLRTDLDAAAATLLLLSAANWAYTWLEPGRDTDELADRFIAILVDGIRGYATPAVSRLLIVNPFASGVDEHRLAAVTGGAPAAEPRPGSRRLRAKRPRSRGGRRGRGDLRPRRRRDVQRGLERDPGGCPARLPPRRWYERAAARARPAAQSRRRGEARRPGPHAPNRPRSRERTTLRVQRGPRLRRGARPARRRARAQPGRPPPGRPDVHEGRRLGASESATRASKSRLEIDGAGRAAFVLVANCSPYTYSGSVALDLVPGASFDGGLAYLGARDRARTRSSAHRRPRRAGDRD